MEAIRKRPVLISVVCIIGYIWIVFSFPGVFSPAVKRLGDWYPALFGLLIALSFISLVGIWHMKRWGVQLFSAAFFARQLANIISGRTDYVGIVLSVLFIVVLLSFYKRMDRNL